MDGVGWACRYGRVSRGRAGVRAGRRGEFRLGAAWVSMGGELAAARAGGRFGWVSGEGCVRGERRVLWPTVAHSGEMPRLSLGGAFKLSTVWLHDAPFGLLV